MTEQVLEPQMGQMLDTLCPMHALLTATGHILHAGPTLQKLVPEIRAEHLEVAPAGVRAQALAPEGRLVDDFLILRNERVLNVCNAPSPAATASLNIGKLIVDELQST